MGVRHSTYITSSTALKTSKTRHKSFASAFLLAMVALFAGLQMVAPALGILNSGNNSTSQTASAGSFGFLCSQKDQFSPSFSSKGTWDSNVIDFNPAANKPNRKWTLNEAYGAGLNFMDYTGEGGDGTTFVIGVGKDRGKKVGNYDDVVDSFAKLRNPQNCTLSESVLILDNLGLQVATIFTSFAGAVSTAVFDSNLICTSATETPGDSGGSKNCVNLLAIIGGNGNNKGIISTLTDGIYLPLVMIITAASGFYVLWIGIVKRKLREALWAFLWVVFAFLIGLTVLLKPQILAKAPMATSNVLASCVIGGYSGNGCIEDGNTTNANNATNANSSDIICKSTASNLSADEQMSMTMNSLSCDVWKAFNLQLYSQGNFGRSYDKLDVKDPDMAKLIKKSKLSPKDFCVPLTSSKSMNDQGSTLQMDSSADSVCNVAAYSLYLGTKAKDTSGVGTDLNAGKDSKKTPFDKNWYKIAVLAANDEGMWNNWSLGFSSAMQKTGIAFIGIITSVLGSALIVVIGILALIYYLTSVIMMAFAPLFFLLGIHPGKGKKILAGYGETVLENVFKYVVSALFLVVTVALYGAVLGNIENIGLTLVFVIILTIALFLYRKELVNLLGRVNMGGQRLSNQIQSKVAPALKKYGYAASGGAVGNVMAGGSYDAKSILTNSMKGAHLGMDRQLKRGNGFVGNMAKEVSRQKNDNKADFSNLHRELERDKTTAQSDVEQGREKETGLKDKVNTARNNAEMAKDELENMTHQEEAVQALEHKVLMEMSGDSPMFAKMQALTNELRNLSLQKQIAQANGDTDRVNEIDNQMNEIALERNAYRNSIDPDELAANQAIYNSRVEEEMYDHNLEGYDRVGLADEIGQAAGRYNHSREEYIAAANEYNDHVDQLEDKEKEYDVLKRKAKLYDEKLRSFKGGEGFTRKEMDAYMAEYDQLATDEAAYEQNVRDRIDGDNIVNPDRFNNTDFMKLNQGTPIPNSFRNSEDELPDLNNGSIDGQESFIDENGNVVNFDDDYSRPYQQEFDLGDNIRRNSNNIANNETDELPDYEELSNNTNNVIPGQQQFDLSNGSNDYSQPVQQELDLGDAVNDANAPKVVNRVGKEELRDVQSKVLDDMKEEHPDFVHMEEINHKLSDVQNEAKMAKDNGDDERAYELNQSANRLMNEKNNYNSKVSSGKIDQDSLDKARTEYNTKVNNEISSRNNDVSDNKSTIIPGQQEINFGSESNANSPRQTPPTPPKQDNSTPSKPVQQEFDLGDDFKAGGSNTVKGQGTLFNSGDRQDPPQNGGGSNPTPPTGHNNSPKGNSNPPKQDAPKPEKKDNKPPTPPANNDAIDKNPPPVAPPRDDTKTPPKPPKQPEAKSTPPPQDKAPQSPPKAPKPLKRPKPVQQKFDLGDQFNTNNTNNISRGQQELDLGDINSLRGPRNTGFDELPDIDDNNGIGGLYGGRDD